MCRTVITKTINCNRLCGYRMDFRIWNVFVKIDTNAARSYFHGLTYIAYVTTLEEVRPASTIWRRRYAPCIHDTRVCGAYEVRQKYLKDNSNTLSLYSLYERYNCSMWIRIRNATDHNILNWLIYSSRNWGMIESNVVIINFYNFKSTLKKIKRKKIKEDLKFWVTVFT